MLAASAASLAPATTVHVQLSGPLHALCLRSEVRRHSIPAIQPWPSPPCAGDSRGLVVYGICAAHAQLAAAQQWPADKPPALAAAAGLRGDVSTATACHSQNYTRGLHA